jgi:ankyrin repeat protein
MYVNTNNMVIASALCLSHRLAALAVQALLKAGASPADFDKAQRSVFHWAADSGNHHSLNAIFAAMQISPSILNAQVFSHRLPIQFLRVSSSARIAPLRHENAPLI